MRLNWNQIARMIDLSAVRAQDDEQTVNELVKCARKYKVCLVTTLPTYTPLAKSLLRGAPDIGVAGNVGFPDGGHTTTIKVAETRELVIMGVTELDVVINLGHMMSGRYRLVLDDLRAVVEAADGLPLKAIIECHYLSEKQIRKACDICIKAGAAFIKTGTGWAPTGATLENVSLIKSHVGDRIAIKAAGGVRGLDTIVEMYRRGATRFGISLFHAAHILHQYDSLPGGYIEF